MVTVENGGNDLRFRSIRDLSGLENDRGHRPDGHGEKGRHGVVKERTIRLQMPMRMIALPLAAIFHSWTKVVWMMVMQRKKQDQCCI